MTDMVDNPARETSNSDGADPRAEYVRRLEVRRRLAAHQARLHRLIADARLAAFLAGVLIAGLAFWAEWITAFWLLVPVLLFVFLVLKHQRVNRTRRRAERAVAFYERGIARL